MTTLAAALTEPAAAQDWHLAEFVMQTWSDPELADQYRRDPVAVLASFGLRMRDQAAADAAFRAQVDSLVVDDLDYPAPITPAFTFCG